MAYWYFSCIISSHLGSPRENSWYTLEMCYKMLTESCFVEVLRSSGT